jgi:uncharacterized membrane protein
VHLSSAWLQAQRWGLYRKKFLIMESMTSSKKTVREKITEGTSAIFLLTGNSTTDKVVNALKQLTKFELISSNLSKEQEGLLRKTFA